MTTAEEVDRREVERQISETTLRQLGGKRFKCMTGAKNFGYSGKTLSFSLPAKPGFTKDGITHVKITLTPADLYQMEFLRVRKGKQGYGIDHVATIDDVYFDQLQELFTQYTGLDTHL